MTLRARAANISLQRTASRRLAAAELGSFAPLSIVAAAVVVVSFCTWPVSACDCNNPPNLKTAMKWADAVFVGEVVGIDLRNNGTTEPPQVVQFRATESWKGIRSADVRVSTGGAGDCSVFGFEQGKRYLVFAKQGAEGLSTGLCMGDFWVWRDYELRDIRKLRPGKKLTK